MHLCHAGSSSPLTLRDLWSPVALQLEFFFFPVLLRFPSLLRAAHVCVLLFVVLLNHSSTFQHTHT